LVGISGTQINYYFFCKTKLWLFTNKINLEDNSEDVRISKVMHEIKEEKGKNTEIAIDNIKIDKITKDYLVEVKKSDSDRVAVKWQVLLYLYKLKQKGVIKKGKIEYIEKRGKGKKVDYIELDKDNEIELLKVLDEIDTLINLPKPPKAQFEKHCKRCAYYEYCFI
jgi:CRISPR-associated exonuclease Cas4